MRQSLGAKWGDSQQAASAAVPSNTTIYDYSGRGERTLKVQTNGGNTITNRYVYSESGQMLADRKVEKNGVRGGTLTEYLFIDSVPVAVNRGSGLSYIEADHLGTPRMAISPATNAKEWSWDFLGTAFGDNAAITSIPGKEILLRYMGQQKGAETGLLYNYFRDYDPALGRYVQSDPAGLKGGVSTYAYVKSRPLVWIDPKGLAASEVVCDGNGGFRVVNRDYSCTGVCTQIHEWSHLTDLQSWAPTICRNSPDGHNPGSDLRRLGLNGGLQESGSAWLRTECKAHRASRECARSLTCCDKAKSYIEKDSDWIESHKCDEWKY